MERTHFWILVLLYFIFFAVYSYLHYAIWRTKSLPKYTRQVLVGIDILLVGFICYCLVWSYSQNGSVSGTDEEEEEDLARWDMNAQFAFQTENEALLRRQLAPPQIKDPRFREQSIKEAKQAYGQLVEFNEMRL